MSEENVEVVRRSFDAWNAADLARWVAMHHPEVEVIPPDGWPEGEPPRSREEWLAQAHRLIDSWAEQRVEPKRIIDAGDRVVALFEWVTRGQGSHIDLRTEMALIATVHGGLITRAVYYANHAEALEAVGLSE
jgi:ketosteroid isomerase-like protein